ncbi:hypothetical protein WHX56_04810 [Achromobacter veterisilvae]|uniref:Uncharacterized protein n=1 Tax=Achromobacter veterisilvae TaxID=2069367 RepID=A0ABZ2S5I0_9BURK|nr:hypothetical protein [Achromobacter sp.]MCW0207945.1 hypothetical protein [Achromobacter sp.]
MRPICAVVAAGLLLGSGNAAQAVPLARIDVGDSYYVHRDLDDNVLVTVVAIDAATRKIKVLFPNGAVDWVAPERLLTQSQNDEDEAASANAMLQVFACMLEPNDPSCKETEWKPGAPHPRLAHVVAGSERGKWRPAAGYQWENPDRFGPVTWSPGTKHPDYEHVVAAQSENRWIPLPGYQWKDPPNLGPVVWTPGMKHRNNPVLLAGATPDSWVPAPGYKWANPSNPTDMTAVPK